MAHHDYQPKRTTPNDSYNAFLDELGFGSGADRERIEFISDLTKHVDYSTFRYVRQSKNPIEFKKMVLDFLTKHGAKYWSLTERNNLAEKDPNKGFLCPRDATRANSRLVMVVTSMFNYKAKSLCKKDGNKEPDKRILSSINEETMTWPPNDNVTTQLCGSRRYRVEVPHRADYDSDEPLRNVIERSRNRGFQYTVATSSWRPSTSHARNQNLDSNDEEEPIEPHKRKRGTKAIVTNNRKEDRIQNLDSSEDEEPIAPHKRKRGTDTKAIVTNNRKEDRIQNLDSSEDEEPIAPHKRKRGTKAIVPNDSEEDYSTLALGESLRASSITPARTTPYYDDETGTIHEAPRAAAVMNRGFTNVFRGHPRATKRSGVAQATRPNPQVETNGDDNNLAASDQSNVAQSNRPIPTVETQDDDDEIIVLERKPSTWQKHEKVKQETVTVKQEQLAVEVTYGTRLVVAASNQPGLAPVNIPLGSVPSFENLFIQLGEACDLRPIELKKITAVSVLYTWTGERQRLRKGRSEDWDYFNRVLSKEYARNPTRFEEGCHVDMMVHVDG